MLRAWRKKNGNTQAEAAKLLGVHQTTVGEWEAGKEPMLQHALRIKRLAKIPVDAWFDDERESGTDIVAAETAKAS